MNLQFRGLIANLFLRFCWLFPIQEKIVFSSYGGTYFNDNTAAVYEAILKKNAHLKYVWLMKDPSYVIEGASVVKATSFQAIYELATARCWIDNKRKPYWVRKRKGQYYVQLWHANISLKIVEKDASDKLGNYVDGAINDSQMADVFVSGSKWQTDNYRSSFWYDGKILECGSPRSDVLYSDRRQKTKKVFDFYHLSNETNVILYAPTFRNSKRTDCYDLDLKAMIHACEEKWGGSWVALIRLHPNIQSKMNELTFNDKILNGSLYPDINELILASKIVITDYSSLIFDSMITENILMMYVKDADEYQKERGLYWKMEELPFLIAYNNNDAVENISRFSDIEYSEKLQKFIDDVGIIQNPHSSESVADEILTYLNQAK